MKLINKDALLAEIDKRIEKYTKRGEESDAKLDGYGMYWGGVISCLNEVQTLCDTLEVKEVDIDIKKEVINFMASDEYQLGEESGCVIVAKHFFELGLKTQKGK